MKKYFFFGRGPNGVLQPLFECTAEEDPTPAQMNTIHEQLVKARGFGAPRPTHYGVMELHEVVQSDEVEPVQLIEHRRGDETVH